MNCILAVDPGNTTGWVMAVYTSVTAQAHPTAWGTFDNLQDEAEVMLHMTSLADHIVCEDYIIYPAPNIVKANLGSKLVSVRVMGRLEYYASLQERTVHYQTASQAKQQWSGHRLKAHYPYLRLYESGRARRDSGRIFHSDGHAYPEEIEPSLALCRHEVDALRHAMTFIENHFKVALVRMEDAI